MAVPPDLLFLEPFFEAYRNYEPLPNEDPEDAECIDILISLLREHVEGTPLEEVDTKIGALFESVQEWLKTSSQDKDVALLLKGFLMLPDLGQELLEPPSIEDDAPTIHFDAPDDWVVEQSSFNLDLTFDGGWASISAIDELAFELSDWHPNQRKEDIVSSQLRASVITSEVCWGPCKGKKHVYREEGEKSWKEIFYALAVPGGYVVIEMRSESGDDFDEQPLERRLCTLSLEY